MKKIRTRNKKKVENIAIAALASLLLPAVLLQSAMASYMTVDVDRLYWLCKDYQLPIEGYVAECWFQVLQMPGMERFLKEQLQIEPGVHQVELQDGSLISTEMRLRDGKWQIALQCITGSKSTVSSYYSLWQQFSNRYCSNHPVGITVIATVPETMSQESMMQLADELAYGLEMQTVSELQTENYLQVTGQSKQFMHDLVVNGELLNSSLTIVPQETCTHIYLAAPLLYQQI